MANETDAPESASGATPAQDNSSNTAVLPSTSKTDSCCPPDALHYIEEPGDYTPQGWVVDLPSTAERAFECRVYITGIERPEEGGESQSTHSKPILIVCHDICGQFSGRHRQLCDTIAEQCQSIVVLPDFFHKTGLCKGYEEESHVQKYGFNNFTWQMVKNFLFTNGANNFIAQFKFETDIRPCLETQVVPYLEKHFGASKFALMGFCWGTWAAFRMCATSASPLVQEKRITCAMLFHPVMDKTEPSFGGCDKQLCRDVSFPQFVMSTKQDAATWHPNGEAHELLKQNDAVSEVMFESTQQSHGYMTRADMNNPESNREIQRSLRLTREFLARHNTIVPK